MIRRVGTARIEWIRVVARGESGVRRANGASTRERVLNPETGAIVFWACVMAAMLVALIAAIVLVKRWMLESRESSSSAWTLHDLNQLRDTGEITIQEYERLRVQTIAGIRTSADARRMRGAAGGANRTSEFVDGGGSLMGCDVGGSTDGGDMSGNDGGGSASGGGGA